MGLPQCGRKAFRVPEMSEVTRTFTGQHLTHRQKHFKRNTSTASPSKFAREGADAASQAPGREKKLIKVQQRGRAARAAPLLRAGDEVRKGGPRTPYHTPVQAG
jgi:hypothetical protein